MSDSNSAVVFFGREFPSLLFSESSDRMTNGELGIILFLVMVALVILLGLTIPNEKEMK